MIDFEPDAGHDGSGDEDCGAAEGRGFDPGDPEPEDFDPLLAERVEWDERRAAGEAPAPRLTSLREKTKGFSMPLQLNVGFQQKKGLPRYGSLGASCHLEVELD